MPVLICIAENDGETPPELARQIAEDSPHGVYKSYPVAHFDLYRPDVRARVLEDQTSFLHAHLLQKCCLCSLLI